MNCIGLQYLRWIRISYSDISYFHLSTLVLESYKIIIFNDYSLSFIIKVGRYLFINNNHDIPTFIPFVNPITLFL